MSNDAVTVIEDVNMVAFLVLRGFLAVPYVKPHAESDQGRVAWDIQGDCKNEIKLFYANDFVPVKDYVRALKEVRAEMYSVKQIDQQRNQRQPKQEQKKRKEKEI